MDSQQANAALTDKLADRLSQEVELREGAKYKLDLLLGREFSLMKPSAGIVSVWASGRALHGDGDTKLYLCPGCDALIPGHAQNHDSAVCSACGKLWKSKELFGEIAYKLPVAKWAEVLEKWFRKLEMQADVRIIYPPEDIRSLAAREQERSRGGELLEHGRSRRATKTYPLKNIMKDIHAGADLRGRFLAFIRA